MKFVCNNFVATSNKRRSWCTARNICFNKNFNKTFFHSCYATISSDPYILETK